MENRFEANILLCEKIVGDNSFEGLFNNIDIEGKKNNKPPFDIGIFLTADIVECKKETFLLDIIYKDCEDENTIPTNILGSLERDYDQLGVNRELCVLKKNKVDFLWEGMYTLELRHCKDCIDINEKTVEEMESVISESEVINSFTFSVTLKKQ